MKNNDEQLLSQTALSNLYTKGIASKFSPSQKIQNPYTIPTDEKTRSLLARLILQEAIETVLALGFRPESFKDRENFILTPIKIWEELNIDDIIDGCCDVCYVSVGALVAMGIPDLPHLQEVNEANNAKFPEGKAIINEKGKYQKPPGWNPPNHTKIMEQYKDKVDLKSISEKLIQKFKG